jgi:hypothetical protein
MSQRRRLQIQECVTWQVLRVAMDVAPDQLALGI